MSVITSRREAAVRIWGSAVAASHRSGTGACLDAGQAVPHGAVAFWLRWRPDPLILVWRPISLAIAVAYLFLLVRDLGTLTREETTSNPTPLWIFVVGLLAITALILPAISLNIHFAFF